MISLFRLLMNEIKVHARLIDTFYKVGINMYANVILLIDTIKFKLFVIYLFP